MTDSILYLHLKRKAHALNDCQFLELMDSDA